MCQRLSKRALPWVGPKTVRGWMIGFPRAMSESCGLNGEKSVAKVAQTGDDVTRACQQIKSVYNSGVFTNFFSSSP